MAADLPTDEARRALARMKAREGENIEEWAERLAADSVAMGEAEYRTDPLPLDSSPQGEGGGE